MAGEGEGQGQGTEGQGSEGQGQQEGQGSNSGAGQESGESSWKPPANQAEFDRMIQDRIRRATGKFGDYDSLKAKAAKFDELDASQKSELEKATEARTEAEKRAEAAEERAKSALVRAAVVAAATKAGAVDPDVVLSLVKTSDLDISDDGEVSGADGVVTALLEDKPYLKGKTFTGSADGGSRSDKPGSYTRAQIRNPEFYQAHEKEILSAMRDGRITD